jgi:lipid-A-disaccharide synthase
MRPHVDRILCLLPFEPGELATLGGPQGVYVGHPLIERLGDLRPRDQAETAARADLAAPEILLLPGSRRSEASRLMPVLGEAAAKLSAACPGARFTLPAVPHLRASIDEAARGWSVPVAIVAGEEAKYAAFRRARAAIAASGTVTLELALAGVPMVGIYRVAEWEAQLARRLIRASSALLPNLVLGRNAIPELLQWDCTPDRIAGAVEPLIADTPARAAQIAAFAELAAKMEPGASAPSARAADEVLDVIANARRDA